MKHLALIPAIALLALSASAEAGRGHGGKKMLERLDSDGDGLVSLAEFQQKESRFMAMDADEDGGVSREEMQAHIAAKSEERAARKAKRRAAKAARMEEKFGAADADGNGLVTAEEAHLAAFNRLDANGDGHIDADELKSRRGKRRQ